MIKTLIICPHPDDEINWCFSHLNKNSTVVILSENEIRSPISREVSNKIGYKLVEDCLYPDLQFPEHFDEIHLYLESIILNNTYDRLLYTATSHHQDHITVNKIMRILTRPLANKFKEVYEYPYLTYDYTEYNAIFEVSEDKFKILSSCSYKDEINRLTPTKSWVNYIKNFNTYIASRHNLQGFYEPFRLIFKSGNL
ncbi:MAG: hypothetical protein M1371_10335 [Actinobacteria bacterium]|nr:hypothetical protein [Actinomycetota bacterium]